MQVWLVKRYDHNCTECCGEWELDAVCDSEFRAQTYVFYDTGIWIQTRDRQGHLNAFIDDNEWSILPREVLE